jgi:hypothetical protein
MDKDKLPKIECTTIVTWRNTMTGETFKDKKEGDNIVQDVTVQVSPKGLDMLQKVMKKHNEKT